MPLPFEDLALKDLVKHPKLVILYAVFAGLGWLGTRLIPDDCQKEVVRWQSLYTAEHRGRDSLQSTKDALYEHLIAVEQDSSRQKKQIKKTDSLIYRLGEKADHLFKNKQP